MTASTGSATASIEVACDPDTAFRVFTADIGSWWKPGTYYWNDSDRGVAMRFEPHVGGRLLEEYGGGDFYEVGRVTVWDPGSRLVFGWRIAEWPAGASTEVDVRFTPTATGTEVAIAHRGWEQFPDGPARATGYGNGWAELLGWYAEKAG
jgi:uncharacterized protein YndB with AHSA1/START domain